MANETYVCENPIGIATGVLTKEQLREKAEFLIIIYNEKILNGNFAPVMEYPDGNGGTKNVLIREVIEDAVNQYTLLQKEECYKALAATDDPMLEAIRQLTFPTIRVVDKKVGEGKEKIPVSSIEDTEKSIDLLRLHKAIKGGIGKDKNWYHYIEKMNLLLTIQKAQDLGIDPKSVDSSYAMSDIARQIDMGKTPTSKTGLLKSVQSIVTAMIGEEYKATSHDVNFLMSVYSKKTRKALTVKCSNHKYLCAYLAEICHRIVEDKKYDLDYKKVK